MLQLCYNDAIPDALYVSWASPGRGPSPNFRDSTAQSGTFRNIPEHSGTFWNREFLNSLFLEIPQTSRAPFRNIQEQGIPKFPVPGNS